MVKDSLNEEVSIHNCRLHVKRLVLLDDVHNVLSEPGHILRNEEGHVATLDHLVPHHSIADGLAGPGRVLRVGQLVGLAYKHSHWYLGDVLQGDEVGGLLRADHLVVVGAKHLESVFPHVLRIQHNALC